MMFIYIFLAIAACVAIAFDKPLIASIPIVIAAVYSIHIIHKTKPSDTDDDGDTKGDKDLVTSIIAGPVQNYQDNTWDPKNYDVKATRIPDALDISGEDGDVQGYLL